MTKATAITIKPIDSGSFPVGHHHQVSIEGEPRMLYCLGPRCMPQLQATKEDADAWLHSVEAADKTRERECYEWQKQAELVLIAVRGH